MKWIRASERLPDKEGIYFTFLSSDHSGSSWKSTTFFNGKRFETGDWVKIEDIEWLDESTSEDYWKKRCEAAEGVLHFCPLLFLSMSENNKFDTAYENWKQLKSQEP